MIQDIEEESKTKFSMDVEFSFSFKGSFELTGKTPCNAYLSVIYYECCKKTRMRISLTVPKPDNGTVSGNKTCGRSKTKWRKET